jgi:hypothetical protein
MCSIKGFEGAGGTGASSLLKENQSLRIRILNLEVSTKRFDLKATFEDPQCLAWKDHPQVKKHVADHVSVAQKEFRDIWVERMIPLAEIGSAVRSRWLEHQLQSGKSVSTIIRGNKAAHSGFALADSLLYHPDHKNARKDVSSYLERYGFSPQRVYQLRGCQYLMTLLSCYGSVKSWRGPAKFLRTPFVKAWPSDFFDKYSKGDIEVVREAFAGGKQVPLLRVLRPLFLNEDAANKRKQEKRHNS